MGHRALVETGVGAGMGARYEAYRAAGADIAPTADDVFARAELIVKVKEPLAPERARLRPGQAVFTYLHLAPDAARAADLVASGATAIAYESVTSPSGGLPLLAPMSEVADRMAIQVAAHYMEKPHGVRGVLMRGATGVSPARILVLGSGVVGSNAATIAIAMGAEATVLSLSAESLRQLAALMVDVSIDQGGCFETSRPTTHAEPVYVVDGIVHYCVANMPGAVPRTSTYALNQATLPFVEELAQRGVVEALRADQHLRNGITVCNGKLTRPEVAGARRARSRADATPAAAREPGIPTIARHTMRN